MEVSAKAAKLRRMCAACRQRGPKQNAQRYVLDHEGRLVYDPAYILPGRGVYVCSQDCYDKVQHGLAPMLKHSKTKSPKTLRKGRK